MHQIIFDFGVVHLWLLEFGLRIYGYGLMMVLGFLSAIALGRWRARQFGENPDVVTNIGLLALVGGVVGARIAFVIEKWDVLFSRAPDPLLEIINISSGGLIYYGGVVLAMAVIVAYLLIKRLPARRFLDAIAPSLMIGLAFGRMGCLLNGCCYGMPARADFPLAMTFPYASTPVVNLDRQSPVFGGSTVSPVYSHQFATGALTPPDYLLTGTSDGPRELKPPQQLPLDLAHKALGEHSNPVLPAQWAGMGNALLLTGLLLAFSPLRRREGEVFALMLATYPVLRFILEIIRGDNFHEVLSFRFTHNQYTSIVMMLSGLILLALLRKMHPSAGPFALERAAQAVSGESRQSQRKGKRR